MAKKEKKVTKKEVEVTNEVGRMMVDGKAMAAVNNKFYKLYGEILSLYNIYQDLPQVLVNKYPDVAEVVGKIKTCQYLTSGKSDLEVTASNIGNFVNQFKKYEPVLGLIYKIIEDEKLELTI